MVLALTPIFFDERMNAERSPAALQLIQGLAQKAISLAGVPDAGIREYRTPNILKFHVLCSSGSHGRHRYSRNDGFGKPTVAFVICTFRLIEALASAGRREEAKAVFSIEFTGNFPQTYSHVGLIHAAFAASPTWTEVL